MRLTLLALVMLLSGRALETRATTLFPYLDPVAAVAADLLAQEPADPKARGVLAKTTKLINSPSRPTLAKDLRLLSVVGPALMRTSVSNAFQEPLNFAVDQYLVQVMAAAQRSSQRLAALPPSQRQAAAQESLQSLNTLLTAINETSDPGKASKLLGRAATKLASTDKLISRAANPPTESGGTTSGSGGTSTDDFRWAVVSNSGGNASTGSTSGGLRVVVSGGDDGWRYMIRW